MLRIIRVSAYLLPGLVIGSIWLPELMHYYIPGAEITSNIVESSKREPSDEVFGLLEDMSLITRPWANNEDLPGIAEQLLRKGRLELKGSPEMQVSLPFREADLERSSPTWKLQFASFLIPDIFLRAYELTGQEKYFDMARQVIGSWATHEGSAWLPKGFLWNDHAVAARIPVLARFWRTYRSRSDLNADEAALILSFVVRSGQLLAKPSHFTFSTNHGVMQNLALWHLSLAFPMVPGVEDFKRIALERFTQQMAFYINDEGIILEHSAGYHRDGMVLIGMGLRYMSLLDIPIPPVWLAKYQQAKTFYAQLRRPDGSLPMFGDTGSGSASDSPLVAKVDTDGHVTDLAREADWRPAEARALYPVAGHLVWWEGLENWPDTKALAQTVVTWSNFPGHGHKLADELSVLFWAAGQTWWTNVGYWPYGVEGRDEAMSWEGSNAPHFIGEPRENHRVARLRYSGWNDQLVGVDIERTGPQGYRVRRQVLSIHNRVWMVIDGVNDSGSRSTRTVWRTYPNVTVHKGSRGVPAGSG
jgi:hypothetical protein